MPQINIEDLEIAREAAMYLINTEKNINSLLFSAGSQVKLVNANGYDIGTLIFDGDFWTFSPDGYGKENK